MKECIKCHRLLPLNDKFFALRSDSPDGFRNDCKECVKKRRSEWHQRNREDQLAKMKAYQNENRGELLAKKREYNKQHRDVNVKKCRGYYQENRDKVLFQMKSHRIKNREEISNRRKIRYHKNPDESMAKRREYTDRNRERIRRNRTIYCANKRKNDPKYRIISNLRSRISSALKNSSKSYKTMDLIGCTLNELRTYLSGKFKTGMTWENYGQWHIDHIVPCSVFDMDDPDEQRRCFHYSNLQPLWRIENLRKANKIYENLTVEEIKERMAL